MSISEPDFRREIQHATKMISESSEGMKGYWRYYCHGLRRLYHGEAYQTRAIHEFRLNLVNNKNTTLKSNGEGYAAGLKYGELRGKNPVGRKQVGEVSLPALWVPGAIKKELVNTKGVTGESLADLRRRYLYQGIEGDRKRYKTE